MKLSQAKEFLPLIQAAAEGKTIQELFLGVWSDIKPADAIRFEFGSDFYRIKPELHLRPWRHDEVPVGAILKTNMCGSRRLILAAGEWGVRTIKGKDVVDSQPHYFFIGWTHSTDGGKTWHACGVEEMR